MSDEERIERLCESMATSLADGEDFYDLLSEQVRAMLGVVRAEGEKAGYEKWAQKMRDLRKGFDPSKHCCCEWDEDSGDLVQGPCAAHKEREDAARAEEREGCARVVEDLAAKAHEFGECRNEGQRLMCAAAIRARGEGPKECDHQWIDPSNEAVNANGYLWCPKCGAVKGG